MSYGHCPVIQRCARFCLHHFHFHSSYTHLSVDLRELFNFPNTNFSFRFLLVFLTITRQSIIRRQRYLTMASPVSFHSSPFFFFSFLTLHTTPYFHLLFLPILLIYNTVSSSSL
ncbi:hypothetical protein BDW69DRAFT_154368 [Aspergillus filifer]